MSDARRGRPRGGWLLIWILIVAMACGVIVGLVVSWGLWPVEYTDVSPDTLHPYHRAEYIVLISHAYAHDMDLRRAQVRLAALGDLGTMGVEVVTLAEQYGAQVKSAHDTQSLSRLAHALGHRRAALAPFMPGGAPTATWTPWPTATATPSPTPTEVPTSTPTHTATATATATPSPTATATMTATPSPTPTASSTATLLAPSRTLTVRSTSRPTATPSRTPVVRSTSTPTATSEPTLTLEPTATRRPSRTPRPTLTPTITSTPEPHYELVTQRRRCEGAFDEGRAGLLRVTVRDAEGEPVPNVELLIRWKDGEDLFFTGLKPEIDSGYADYELSAGESYQVGIVGFRSDVAQGIVADACENGTLASWTLLFRLRDSAP